MCSKTSEQAFRVIRNATPDTKGIGMYKAPELILTECRGMLSAKYDKKVVAVDKRK
jgi:hypothetical protein